MKNIFKRLTPTRLFVGLGFCFGALLVFLVPPFQSPDEFNHFFRAYQISEGHFIPEKPENQRLGGTLPGGLDTLSRLFLPLKGDYSAKCNRRMLDLACQIRLDESGRRFADFPNTAIYAPTAYLPQAMGILLLRLFTDRVMYMVYAARLANLLLWLALVVVAIRQIPFHKWVVITLALLPASLVIAASCSADVVTNGLAFCLLALCMGQKIKGLLSWVQRLGMVLLISVNKLVFAPYALVMNGSFGLYWKNTLKQSMLPLALAFSAAMAWGHFAHAWFVPYDRYDPVFRDAQTLNPGVDPPAQMDYIQAHPIQFAKTVAVSFFRAVPSIGAHWVGKFGWEKNYLPAWMLVLLWLALAGVICSEENPLNWRERAWLAAIVLFCVGLWAVTIYALWCPVGAAELDNWQGRYFIPLGPLVAMIVGAGWGRNLRQWTIPLIVGILLLGNAVQVLAVIGRYYG